MDKQALWKWLVLIVLVATSLALVTPPTDRLDDKGNVVRAGKIRYGLDLKGGTSFVVKIDEDQVRRDIREKGEGFTDEQVEAEVRKVLDGSQARALEVLRNRIDNLGIAEPIIYPTKDNRITIQLPGVNEQKRKDAEASIKSVAFLEFRIVHEQNQRLTDALFEKSLQPPGFKITHAGSQPAYVKDVAFPDAKRDPAYRSALGRFHVPDATYEFMLEKQQRDGQEVYLPRFVKRRRELSGEYLKSARVDYQQLGQPVVLIEFDGKGAKLFSRVTADYAPGGAKNPNPNEYRQLAIVLDGTLYSAPVIREAIHGGRAEISGSFTLTEANFLANVLKAGSLPAPVQIVERRIVDPSLGADSIRSGVSAGIYGCAAVFVLMALYYLIPGLLANTALILNIVLLPLGMIAVAGFLDLFSGLKTGGSAVALPVLTLPGIAGIALTIGMAVDANVLIFERIREELRAGKTFAGAIQSGYERAFTAIFDSNITTIITGVILFLMGSGPVRGYSITLIAGLIVSLYTAVIVTRMVFNLIAARTSNMAYLRMFQLFHQSKLDFMRWWKLALGISGAIIAVTWAIMVVNGLRDSSRVFAVDFTGGTAVTLSFKADQKPDVESVRATLAGAGVPDASIQYQRALQEGEAEVLEIKVGGSQEGAQIEKALDDKFASAEFKVMQQDDVGPQIGSELKRKAVWAMGWSLVAMILYIAFRFELGFALGAVVALFHDVLITAGIVHLLGFQVSMTVVAALLTIVGYSVNDTIVIFDRIRENLRMNRGTKFIDLCNDSMNQTLSRTLLTNFLTFVSVLALVIFGGGSIRDFAVTMFIGMIAGTYSTMYIATPVVLMWYRFKTPDLGSSRVK